jgi:hypothetical protein
MPSKDAIHKGVCDECFGYGSTSLDCHVCRLKEKVKALEEECERLDKIAKEAIEGFSGRAASYIMDTAKAYEEGLKDAKYKLCEKHQEVMTPYCFYCIEEEKIEEEKIEKYE